MATKMDSVNPSHCDSGAKGDHTLAALTDGRTSKSDSSSDDDRPSKSGANSLQQNNMNSSQSQKRPMNAFLIFCKRHRSVVRQKYPHLENRSITKILGEWWAALDSDQKLKYTELARQYKEAFMKANPHFKWYKTTDLRPPTAPPSPPPPPPPPVETVVMAQNTTQPAPQPQPQTHSTPKPPKKRYLENLENGDFKAINNANQNNVITNAGISGGQSSAVNVQNQRKSPKLPSSGPPILDQETANRVIENALSGSLSAGLTPNARQTTREQSAFNSDVINGHINSVLQQHKETQELEALGRCSPSKPRSDVSTERTSGSNPTHSTSTDKSATNSISNPVSTTPPLPSEDEELEDENIDDEEEKPLNLSASTVLHTSNQHIIDHFIDKLLSTGIEGTSSASLSLPFSSPSLSSMSPFNTTSSGNDNKINNNYMKSINNNNKHTNNMNTKDNTNCNSMSTNTGTGAANKAQSRKDRSCKGKRYLEILNESKFGKRSRTVSSMSSSSDKDETSAKNLSSKDQSGAGCASKWVSGGFDLEEHIAQLPQLGDTHLLNALSHSKANKTLSSSRNGSNDSNHSKPQNVNNSSVNESNNNSLSDRSNSDNEDNDMTVENRDSNQFKDNTLRHYTTDANVCKTTDNNSEQSVCETNNQSSDQTNKESAEVKADETIATNVSNDLDSVNSLPTTQGIEFSDGLSALAEVALQQQRNSV